MARVQVLRAEGRVEVCWRIRGVECLVWQKVRVLRRVLYGTVKEMECCACLMRLRKVAFVGHRVAEI